MIQVAAPEKGLYYDCRSDMTDFQQWSDSFKSLGKGRMVFRSKWVERIDNEKRADHGMSYVRTATYRRPIYQTPAKPEVV